MHEHPKVPLNVWAQLPSRLQEPLCGFPSAKRDGSIVVVIVDRDDSDDPIVAPILWDAHQKLNVVLSVYGRSSDSGMSGDEWIKLQIKRAAEDELQFFGKFGSADAKPKPEPAEATSWSSGSIPVDRPTEPKREILTLRKKSTKS